LLYYYRDLRIGKRGRSLATVEVIELRSRMSTKNIGVTVENEKTPEKKSLQNNDFVSPTVPRRVPSSNSLFGEDIVNSVQCFVDCNDIFDSYSEDEHTTPPSTASLQQLSPPPLHPFSNGGAFVSNVSPINSVAKKLVGRPPIPHVPIRNGIITIPPNIHHHQRCQSVGESSVVSALTDRSDEEYCRRTNRSFPWEDSFLDLRISNEDFEVVIGPQGGNESILQPILDDEPPRLIRASKS